MNKQQLHDFASTSETGMPDQCADKKTIKGKKGHNPFFGNSLPFQLGNGGRWFNDSRAQGKMSFLGGKSKKGK